MVASFLRFSDSANTIRFRESTFRPEAPKLSQVDKTRNSGAGLFNEKSIAPVTSTFSKKPILGSRITPIVRGGGSLPAELQSSWRRCGQHWFQSRFETFILRKTQNDNIFACCCVTERAIFGRSGPPASKFGIIFYDCPCKAIYEDPWACAHRVVFERKLIRGVNIPQVLTNVSVWGGVANHPRSSTDNVVCPHSFTERRKNDVSLPSLT